MTQSVPQPARHGVIVHVDADVPPEAVAVEPGITDVLVVVHHDRAVIGQVWLPARPVLTAEAQAEAIATFAANLEWRRVRTIVERALGRPQRQAAAGLRSMSVVVCTRDRADQLEDCLRSLQGLARPGVELLVVDNGSKGPETAEVCERLGVRCVVEARPGQTKARNLGIQHTTGELIAFTDDDVTVDPDWLTSIDSEFDDPLTMVATGYIGPRELAHTSQVWFEAHGGFERHGDRRIFDPQYLGPVAVAASAGAGANMVIRRALFTEIGGFDEDFGAGTPTRTSDDKLLFYRAAKAGYRIRYDPSRKVWHQHRRDEASLRRIMRDYGTGEFAWTGHVLAADGFAATGVTRIWSWWARHYLGDLKRLHRGEPTGVPAWVTAEEVRGVLSAPRALRSVTGFAPAGGPGPGEGWAPDGVRMAAQVGRVSAGSDPRVVAEPAKVTVALASYNRRDALRGVLERLQDQSLAKDDYEIVVVIDGSTDGSAEMVRAFDGPVRPRLVVQDNAGLAVARNAGAQAAEHDLVVFLDDDIEPRHGHLAGHVAAHASQTTDGWAMGYFPPLPTDGLAEQSVRTWWIDHFARKASPEHRWTMADCVDGNSSAPVRLVQAIGGFDEDFTGGRRQDHELGARLLAAGIPMRFARGAHADHHFSADLRTLLRNARSEGRYDVLLARKHPGVISQLVLSTLGHDSGSGRARAFARLGLDRSVALGARLEALGRRGAWFRVMGLSWRAEYAAGVREGIAQFGPLPGSVGAPPAIDITLRDGDHAARLQAVGEAELVLFDGAHRLGAVPAVMPGAQWDWDDVVQRCTMAIFEAGVPASWYPFK